MARKRRFVAVILIRKHLKGYSSSLNGNIRQQLSHSGDLDISTIELWLSMAIREMNGKIYWWHEMMDFLIYYANTKLRWCWWMLSWSLYLIFRMDFFCYLSCYNKIQYKIKSKMVIFDSFCLPCHRYSIISSNGIIFGLEDVHIVYFMEKKLRLFRNNIYLFTNGYDTTRKFSSNLQCKF